MQFTLFPQGYKVSDKDTFYVAFYINNPKSRSKTY